MIGFFRKIRKQLLTNERFTKYLLYAVGEIILVVIGILIALQINNWNTSKKETAELRGYLSDISNNIQSDLQELSELRLFRDSSKAGAIAFLAMSEKPIITRKEMIDFFDQYSKHLPIFDQYFRNDESGFDALKNSGYLSKLQNTSVKKSLFTYHNTIAEIGEAEKSLNNFIEDMETEMFKDNVLQQAMVLLRDSHDPHFRERMEPLLKHPAFIGVNMRVAQLNTMNRLYDELQVQGDEVLRLIEDW